MENRRKTTRFSINQIPEILRKPILLYNFEEVNSEIENLSSFGIGLLVDKNANIDKGDIFYLKYHLFESDIKCICVFSDSDENNRSIGAYFTDKEDRKIIMEYLFRTDI